jgi:hypothetical protein
VPALWFVRTVLSCREDVISSFLVLLVIIWEQSCSFLNISIYWQPYAATICKLSDLVLVCWNTGHVSEM